VSASLRVVIGLLAFSLFGFVVSGQSIYARLSYLWVFIILGNYLLSRIALAGLEVTRQARLVKAQVGEIYEENFEIRNRARFPRIWLEIRDCSTLPGARGSRVLTFIGARRTRTYVSRTRLAQRGAFSLGPTELHSGDPFGFFPVSRVFPARQTLTIYPRLVEVTAFPSPPGLLPGGEAIRRRTHQITPNAATVRDYETGDPLNRIHWTSSARRDRLMVKEFELDPLAEIWLFLDAEARSQAALPYEAETDAGSILLSPDLDNKLAPDTAEYGASIAASVARHFLRQRRSVGFMAAGRTLDMLPADRGGRQLGKLMEMLALLRADGDVPYAGFVSGQARYLTRGSTVILITPSADKSVALLVDQLLRLGLRPIAVLLDASTFGGETGSHALAASIKALGVPCLLIREGQNLAATFRAAPTFLPTQFAHSSLAV
jgi:uncharacterized protein (DUF58 family)